MQQLELKDPAAFAAEFLRQTQLQGFGALSKRDLELLVFVLLERDGAIDRNASNHAAAQRLRVTPAKLRALRRDGYARWRQLVAEPADAALRSAPHTIVSPHAAFFSDASVNRLQQLAAEEGLRALKGEPLRCALT